MLVSPKVFNIVVSPDDRIASTIVEPDLGNPIIKIGLNFVNSFSLLSFMITKFIIFYWNSILPVI